MNFTEHAMTYEIKESELLAWCKLTGDTNHQPWKLADAGKTTDGSIWVTFTQKQA